MLTGDQIRKLHKAIDLAEQSLGCQYISHTGNLLADGDPDYKPCCVIGQYAYLSGVSFQQMHMWGTQQIDDRDITEDLGVDKRLLREIQKVWDGQPPYDNIKASGDADGPDYFKLVDDERRLIMHEIVNKASRGETFVTEE